MRPGIPHRSATSKQRNEILVEIEATVEGLRQFAIHGDPYTQVYYSVDGSTDTIQQARLGTHDLPEGLKVGDRIVIYSVLGIVAEIRLADQP